MCVLTFVLCVSQDCRSFGLFNWHRLLQIIPISQGLWKISKEESFKIMKQGMLQAGCPCCCPTNTQCQIMPRK